MAKLKTGRHTSALKEARKSLGRKEHNKVIHSKIRTLIKKVEDAAAKKDSDGAKNLLKTVFSELDKAARKNILHSNNAANQKSRLSKLVKSIAA
ncbi:MAG: 30S ribosomal protein S20 [Endomicrobiales bacterium]|nr:30S ribosomal protein S20 [Endomicrobiales bacterium]